MGRRLAANRDNWNERTPVYATSAFYDVEGFTKGRITLSDIERREAGDVSARRSSTFSATSGWTPCRGHDSVQRPPALTSPTSR